MDEYNLDDMEVIMVPEPDHKRDFMRKVDEQFGRLNAVIKAETQRQNRRVRTRNILIVVAFVAGVALGTHVEVTVDKSKED